MLQAMSRWFVYRGETRRIQPIRPGRLVTEAGTEAGHRVSCDLELRSAKLIDMVIDMVIDIS